MEASINLGTRQVSYTFRPSNRRRTVSLVITPQDGLIVRGPTRLAQAELRALLLRKARWILRHLTECQQPQPAPIHWKAGMMLPFQGVPHQLSVRPSQSEMACVTAASETLLLEWPREFMPDEGRREQRPNDQHSNGAQGQLTFDLGEETNIEKPAILAEKVIPAIQIPTRFEPPSGVFLREVMVSWLKEQSQQAILARMETLAIPWLSKAKAVRVKDQKSRWGSCSSKGGLNFNWRLILAPPEVLNYVVVHELCHLKEMNHSARFWGLVEGILPGYAQSLQWLRANGAALHRW